MKISVIIPTLDEADRIADLIARTREAGDCEIIVVDGGSEIRLVVAAKGSLQPQLSCDGEVRYTASAGDEIVVTKKDVALQLVHPLDHSFYQACRSKLGWGSRLVRVDD